MASTLEILLFTYCIDFIIGIEGNEPCIIFKKILVAGGVYRKPWLRPQTGP